MSVTVRVRSTSGAEHTLSLPNPTIVTAGVAPSTPTALTAMAGTVPNSVILDWPDSVWAAGTTNRRYEVHEDLYNNADRLVTTVTTSSRVSGALAPATYRYYVVAVDSNGRSAASPKVTVTVPISGPPPVEPPPPQPGVFPNAATTGVPAGVTLTPSGGVTVAAAGTVIENRDITGPVVINAPNVTIRKSRIRANSMWIITNNSTNLVVEDCDIANLPGGARNAHNAIGNSNFTLRRCDVSGSENGANIDSPGNIVIEDCYIHDLDTSGPSYVWGNTPHTDGIQVGQAARNLIIRRNTIDPSPGGGVTSGIILYTPKTGTPNDDVFIEDNYIDGRGASYCVYAPRVATGNVHIDRNSMHKASYGYTACVKVGSTVATFNGNKDAGTGAAIAADNGAGGSCDN